ncbi:MAG: hypothetical protein GY928_02005 [Colwellia sp.]|nr:hypothetical protein [Colwellia sp.]
MIHCKTLNKDFKTKTEMFEALKANKDEIIEFKKKQIQKSCEKGISVVAKAIDPSKFGELNKAFDIDDDFYYIAVNTTKILDSHEDLHINGIWDITVSAQQGKNYLVADHKLELDKVIAKKEHVEMFIAMIPFRIVGKDFKGNTQALIYKIRKDKVINKTAKEWLDSGDDIEASVRMQYVTILLAMDSDAKANETEKKNFDKYISQIANKDDFEEILFFWAITEAKNVHESSLVIFGSNNATGQIVELDKNKQRAAEQALIEKEAAEQALQGIDYVSLLEKI